MKFRSSFLVKYGLAAACVSILLLVPGLIFAQPEPPVGKAWEKVESLSDEFNAWNSAKWTKSLWNYGEPVMMKSANSGVSDGKLWIKATLGSDPSRWFETSRVMSRTRIKFPMYTESRMRTAHISAYSTYWLNNGNSANRDEIDIIEHNTNPSRPDQEDRPYTMYSQYFIVKDNVTERHHGNFDNRNLSEGNPAKGKKWNEEYQVLGCWWKDEHNIQFYINGEPAGKVTSVQEFTLSQNIIWDLWTIDAEWSGGIASKADLGNDSINTYYIDWIHTYRLVDGPDVALESISISDSLGVHVNETGEIGVEFEPANTTERDLSWISLNENIATVDENGIVSGVDTGKTRIIVEALPSRHKDTCVVSVLPEKIKATEVIITPAQHIMAVDSSFQLESQVNPPEAWNKDLSWRSSNISIATVDSSGRVYAHKTGFVSIYAKNEFAGITGKCAIQVVDQIVRVPEVREPDISIHPNPAGSYLSINGLENLFISEFSIHNLQGKNLLNIPWTKGMSPVIDLQQIPAGIHVISITHDNGTESLKLVKSGS